MRVCAIDYGDARTGVAVSDPTGLLAGHTETIRAYRAEAVAERVAEIARERGAGRLVLGCPVNMDGTRGARAEKAEAFAETLRDVTGLPVTLWDERLTTVDAHKILRANGKNGRKRKNVVDAVAAALILESYLAWERGQALQTNAPPSDGKASQTDAPPSELDALSDKNAPRPDTSPDKDAPPSDGDAPRPDTLSQTEALSENDAQEGA